ncbi:50S ribosomal protein L35 [Gammaproteobacteria bacterium]|nr:50S ribosomal protein L35 [Gammaproteobacteria bacterium]
MKVKLKTNKGAAKRFSVKASGRIKRRKAYRNHILTKKSVDRKRRLRAPGAEVSASDARNIKRLLKLVS